MTPITFNPQQRRTADQIRQQAPQQPEQQGTKFTLGLSTFNRWRKQYENEREYDRATRDSDSTEVHEYTAAASGTLVNHSDPCAVCGRMFSDLIHNRERFRDQDFLLTDAGEEPFNLSIDDSLERWASRRSYSDSDADELYGLIYESRETRSQGRNQPWELFQGLLLETAPDPDEEYTPLMGERVRGTYRNGVFTPARAGDRQFRWERELARAEAEREQRRRQAGAAARLRKRLDTNAQIISVMRACNWPEDRIVSTMQALHLKMGLTLNQQALQAKEGN